MGVNDMDIVEFVEKVCEFWRNLKRRFRELYM